MISRLSHLSHRAPEPLTASLTSPSFSLPQVGDYTEENLKEVQRLNKGKLKNLDLINVGLELVVPDNREIAEAPAKEVKAIEEVKTEVAPVAKKKPQKKKEAAPAKKQQKKEPKAKKPLKEDPKKKPKKEKPAKAPKQDKEEEKPAKGGFLFFGGKTDPAKKKKKDAKLPQDKW